FDTGPSFFFMQYEFTALMEDIDAAGLVNFEPLDPLYVVNFRDTRKTYRIYKDIGRLANEFKEVEPGFEKKMNRFLEITGKLFHDTENKVVKRNFNSILHFLAVLTTVPLRHAPKMIRSFWQEIERHFESREVKEIFSLVAFFLGATPFDTPAVYTLLAYTELKHDGYYNVKGGMYTIVEAMEQLLVNRGVKIVKNTEIVSVDFDKHQVNACIDQNGSRWEADIVVANADAAWFRGKMLNRKGYSEKKLSKMKWTMAPFTIYLGVKGKVPGLDHHNYFLGNNFKEYSDKIFKNSVSLDKPYYYVNVLSKYNAGAAPEGCESLYILCPVPDLRFKPVWDDREVLYENIIDDLSNRLNFSLKDHIITKKIMTPIDWKNTFNLYQGSGLGLAHNINQIGAFRPSNRDKKLKNLFYVGSSTVPGTGLPMAVISSKLVTERIEKRYGSIH
ncbi:MAG: phytoene desaturase family protein, partial [Bacteroidales bacterium]|nr:phytoene desaturase family protein [Bacteroidales bacterium]